MLVCRSIHARSRNGLRPPRYEPALSFLPLSSLTNQVLAIYPTLTIFGGGTIPYIQGMAFYLVEGTVNLEKEKD